MAVRPFLAERRPPGQVSPIDILMRGCQHHDVRTTLTLDDDVADALKTEARRSGRPFKAIVNDLLRTALHLRRKHRATPPFKIHARALGVRPGLDYDRIPNLVERLEGRLQR